MEKIGNKNCKSLIEVDIIADSDNTYFNQYKKETGVIGIRYNFK